ncbi:MAG: hypothetical protein J0I48_21925 [Devosia sp.]|mgnify:CR=1 FL=1|uniref:hypothetical protein n=1 Tax=Devosia sp. 66-22 TaxID=1895753 RepID=UPI000925FF60|nr:hypothetical protein [Devosia sp. 66-22]MBN9348825.1 hypothetical protein [Devosia sp.]OJX50606.1 MAG: hypothetical protein BGO81_20340 [Devosia sp. 66-22]
MADWQAAFIERFHQMVDELDRSGRSDPETMLLLGSFVSRLLANDQTQSWTQVKLGMDDASLRELVGTLDDNATSYEAEGKSKAAYVARLLGASLVAGRLDDPRTRQRDQLLSHFIDTAAHVYTSQRATRADAEG